MQWSSIALQSLMFMMLEGVDTRIAMHICFAMWQCPAAQPFVISYFTIVQHLLVLIS